MMKKHNMRWLHAASAVQNEELMKQLRGVKFKPVRIGRKKAEELKDILEKGERDKLAEFLAWCLASNGVVLSTNNVRLD